MKKNILILSVLLFALTSLNAQTQIINPGFETWTNDALVPSAMNPNSGNNTFGWWDYNYFNNSLLGASPISVTRCTDTVHSGSYSVRLETKVYTPTSWNIYKAWGYPFIGHEYNDTLGILFNGKVNVTNQTFIPGIPFTERISEFKFYYQYRPNGNDTAEFRVALLNTGTYIGGGIFKTNASTLSSGWQQGSINLSYINGLTPDTLYVLISSSSLDYKPSANSVLWIDDISVVLSTGIEQKLVEENFVEIFPNPSTDKISFNAKNIENIEIFDIHGKQIYFGKERVIDLSQHSKGIYIIKIKTDTQIISRKLIKQ